jgi:hypothetical protein
LLLTHVPPVVGESVIVFPTHTDDAAETLGFALTVTVAVEAEQPVVPSVKVKATVPAATPVTSPAFVTDAIALLLLNHVPPDEGDKVIVPPTHKAVAEELIIGSAFTVTEEVVLLHPVAVCVKVKVALPVDSPVTTPELVTVATEVLVLTQVPPEVGERVIVLPIQTEDAAVTVGGAFIVITAVVAEQFVVASENVKVALPDEIPVTIPAFVTVATEVLLLTHVPPDEGVNVTVPPIHTDVAEALTIGTVFTVTAEVVLLHPVDVSVNVKVALPVAIPVTTPALVIVATEGLLLIHVPPVLGESVIVLPTQTEDGADTLGFGFTLTVAVPLTVAPEHKDASVTETREYVVEVVGLTIIL